MEGKSFYGKTTSPKVIAEASLAYSFSFDLQRFTGDSSYTGWSIGGSDDLKDKLVYMSSGSALASLTNDGSGIWSIGGGSSGKSISLDLTDTLKVTSNEHSITGSDISGSLGSYTKFDASKIDQSTFSFKLSNGSKITSILGSNQGDSIDASAVTGGNLSITGGSGNDTLIAGTSGTFYLDGGAGDDSLVGGNGKDYFIYDGSGSDSISGYGSGDIVSLSAFPGVASVGTDSSNHLVLNFGTTNNSLTFADTNSKDSVFTIIDGTDTYYYNKNYIRSAPSTSTATFSLTSAAVSLDASSYSAVSIDGTAANGGSGLKIFGTSGKDSIIGSNTKGTSIYGNGGNDFVSLNSGTDNVDIFVYNGKGSASIEGLGSSGFVSLSATKPSLITAGSALDSIGENQFKLTFGTNNELTFIGSASASIKAGDSALVYTPTAISIAGAGDAGDSVTLGADYKDSTFGTSGSKFTLIDASAVASNMSAFAIAGSTSSGNRLIGSDNIITSILGGSGDDMIYAGKEGASLVGNGGNDSLFGDTAKAAKDYFFYNGGKALITNYTNSGDNEDVVSLTGSSETTAPTNTSRFSLDSGTNTFNISLGASGGDNVLSFASSRQVNIHAVGNSNINTLFHYEADKVIVDDNRVTLGSNFKGSNYKVSSLGETYENMASIDASAVTTSGGLNITGHESANNSIIGAKFGGKIIGGTDSDYLESGVVADGSTVTTTIDAGIDPVSGTIDTLVGGNGYDWFIYRGAKASIGGYSSGQDTIQVLGEGLNMMSEDEPPVFATVAAAGGGGDLVLALGTNSLSVAGGAASNFTTTFRYGQNTFNYNSGAVSLNNKSVTLTSDYQVGDSAAYTATGSISAVNASAVTLAAGSESFVSLQANDNFDTRLIGSSIAANALISGSKNNDYLSGGNAADIFVYTGGKDTVANYQYNAVVNGTITDSLSADNFVDNIATGKVSGTKLIFTGSDNKNVLTFLSDDDAIEKVSLSGGGYLTKDGNVSNGLLKLFSSAKGEIDLTDTSLYKLGENGSTSNITSVDAAAAKQSIILTTDSLSSDATYILPGNKKRDRFMYAGGKVSISGYEGGKDQINLGDGSIKGFAISDKVLQISVSSSDNDIISIAGGNSADLLIHQSTDANNIYRKMALTQAGILTNRVSKPTTATVLGGAASLDANENALGGGTIKKIFAANESVEKVSIEAGNKNNTTINMSAAGSGVSIYGGKKNDKITGSNTEGDLFVYRTDSNVGGKDVITNYTSGSDVVSIGAGALASLSGAKITARDKSVMIKFSGNKNSLNLKNSDSNITAVTIRDNGTTDTSFTFGKSSFSTDSGKAVSLTSAFSGSFDLSKVKLGDNSASSVDGHLVGKNLTYKGTAASETLSGGSRKTTFKGGGGTDELTGGSGKDIFTYAKGNAGTTTIKDFDYTKDQIKIAGGTLDKIETISGGVRFAMKNNGSNIGWYDITSAAAYKKDGTKDTANVLEAPNSTTVFKANNTYFWFAQETVTDEVTVKGSEDKETVTLASAGDLITYNTRVSASDVSHLNVIDLNYSTNLVKSGVAVAVSKTASKADMPNK